MDIILRRSIKRGHNGVTNAGHPSTGSLGFPLWRMVLRSLPARDDKHIPPLFVDVFGLVAIHHTPGIDFEPFVLSVIYLSF